MKNKSCVIYTDIPSAILSVPPNYYIPIPIPPDNLD